MSFTQDDVTVGLNGIYRLNILKVYETRSYILGGEPMMVSHHQTYLTAVCLHYLNGYLRIL